MSNLQLKIYFPNAKLLFTAKHLEVVLLASSFYSSSCWVSPDRIPGFLCCWIMQQHHKHYGWIVFVLVENIMLIVDEMKAKEADVQANQKMYILALLNWWNWFKRLWQTLKYKRLMKLGTSVLQRDWVLKMVCLKYKINSRLSIKVPNTWGSYFRERSAWRYTWWFLGSFFRATWGILRFSGWEGASRWGQAATEQWILLSVSYQTAVFHLHYQPICCSFLFFPVCLLASKELL